MINDRTTLREALTFIKRSDGKQAADDGYHDDRIMSLAIAQAARCQQTYIVIKKEGGEKSTLPFALQDETDDYNLDEEDFELEW